TGHDWSWFPLNNPGILSIPIGFLCGFVGTVLSKEYNAEKYAEIEVRSLTGAGAATAVKDGEGRDEALNPPVPGGPQGRRGRANHPPPTRRAGDRRPVPRGPRPRPPPRGGAALVARRVRTPRRPNPFLLPGRTRQ